MHMNGEEKTAWAIYSVVVLFMLMIGIGGLIKESHKHELDLKLANCILKGL